MSARLFSSLTLAGALGCALIAGTFFAFSTFVMPALARLPARQGIAAMQSINITVINWLFMAVLFGSALLTVLLAVMALVDRSSAGATLRIGACLLYCVGTIGVTIAGNVPLNDELARVSAESREAEAAWARYLTAWPRWNHLRGAAAISASAALIFGADGCSKARAPLIRPLPPSRQPSR